jgi:hypothetical protein
MSLLKNKCKGILKIKHLIIKKLSKILLHQYEEYKWEKLQYLKMLKRIFHNKKI